MRGICLGVYVHAEPSRLLATLASVRANTPPGYELLLLPDAPDAATRSALARMRDLAQAATAAPLGAAACFNRLASYNDAAVVVLLESGALPGPGWLQHLLSALDADPRNGLAGPSTNRCWNEQNIRTRRVGTVNDVALAAAEAERRFGGETRGLEPLYGLADFCYAVKREVIEAVGAADERYRLGPCWEMDYNIRAARAGFRGVWACASYVHRAPPTARRRAEEARHFAASRRLYQDKFCGARLRGEKSDFRAHCRGDDCPNFAPPALIQIRSDFPPARTPPVAPSTAASSRVAAPKPVPVRPTATARPAVEIVSADAPLVTCIMPTFDRRSYVPQAIRCFLRQSYPNLELLVVDDGGDPVRDCVPEGDERIRYVRLDERLNLGAKRNLACEEARGRFIVHWDDDDWYPPRRVGAQVRALIEHAADVSGTSRVFYYDAADDRAWEYSYRTKNASWVGGNTLAYRREFWARNKFPDVNVGEDSRFLWSGVSKKICDLSDPSLCVASLHRLNTSRKVTRGAYWHARPSALVHQLLGDERYLYRAVPAADEPDAWPLVTCIMPTFDRRPFVPLALEQFARQDYPRKELIVVDDGTDKVGDLCEGLPDVRYVELPRRATIGAKRNLACRLARGEIISQWDDDDWYATDRLRYQAAPLLEGRADITGLINTCVLELPGGEFWTTDAQLHRRMFVGNVHGGTLTYRREILSQGVCYPEVNLAEDAQLLRRAVRAGRRLLRLANPGLFVYVRHGRNAWRQCAPGRFLDPAGWERVERPATFSARTLAAFAGAAARVG